MSGTHSVLAHVQEADNAPVNTTFLNDVLRGLSQPQKSLSSKYFYDEAGDHLFQRIMRCDDYYLTRCEMEVFREKANELVSELNIDGAGFDLVELGAGDGIKTRHLLRYLSEANADFRYLPVDISGHILDVLCAGIQQNMQVSIFIRSKAITSLHLGKLTGFLNVAKLCCFSARTSETCPSKTATHSACVLVSTCTRVIY